MDTFINTMHFCDRDSNATGIPMTFRNIYGQLDNMHISVAEHSYQNDKYAYRFHLSNFHV